MSTDHLSKKQRMRPGVKALIVHEGKILMVHERVYRNGNPVEISDFPGGGIEFGESLQEALKREVKEEVSLDISIDSVVGAWDFVLGEKDHDYFKDGVHIVCIAYQCHAVGDISIDVSQNPANEEIYEAKWYTREEILSRKDEL